MNAIEQIIGWNITDIRGIHNYWQIVFGDATLTVYVPISVWENNVATQLDRCIGEKVVAACDRSEIEKRIDIILEHDLRIMVNMDDNFRSGPEALVLAQPGRPFVVWQ